jgi:acyl-coenzyme A thioesterase PaaI-like protein
MNLFPDLEKLKLVPNQKEGKCFACGQAHETGLKMKFYTDENAVYSKLKVPNFLCGWSNLTHGGIITTILDEVIAWTVIYLKQNFMLTKNISVDFLKPVFVETEVYVTGKILEEVSKRELKVEASIFNQKQELCSKSIGNIVLLTKEQLQQRKIIPESFLENFSEEVFGK